MLLLHRALIEDRPEDSLIRMPTPPEQHAEFSRYAALTDDVVHTPVLFSLSLAAGVEGHHVRLPALLALAGWGLERPRRKCASARGPSPPAELFPVTGPPTFEAGAVLPMDGVARFHARRQRCGLAQSWSGLWAIETVLDEVRGELGGADVALQDLVERFTWSRGRLLSLCEVGEPFTGAIELPGREGETVRLLRAAVRWGS